MVGKEITHFFIIKKIGEGGMGEIYEAEDINLKRKVVLKFLAPRLLDSADAKERFLQEARLASHLDHPNICTIHEVNETGDGQLFIAMPLYKGKSLKEAAAARTLETREWLDILIQVAAGLEHAHQAGIVHRDIKPANIFITDNNEVKILDFGLARLENEIRLTKTGATIGTAAYMSPEQVEGKAGDQRMDIWAFGVLLFELLTGKLPFQGKDVPSLLYAIVHNKPRNMEELNPSLPPELIKLVERCLQKNPDERPRDAAELRQGLSAMADKFKQGRAAGKTRRFRKSVRFLSRVVKGKAFPAAVGGVLVLLVLFLVFRFLLPALSGAKLPENKHIAVLPFLVEKDNAMLNDLSNGLVQTLTAKLTLLEKFNPLYWVLEADQIYKNSIFDPGLASLKWGVNIVITGSLEYKDDNVILNLKIINAEQNRIIKARRYTRSARDLSFWQENLLAGLMQFLGLESNNEIRETLNHGNTALPGAFGFFLQGCGKLHLLNNRDELESAIGYFTRAVEQDPRYVWAYTHLAAACLAEFNLTKEQAALEAAEKNGLRAAGLNSKLGYPCLVLGDIYSAQRLTDKAEAAYNQALRYNSDDFVANNKLAKLYRRSGRLAEVENSYKKLIDCRPDFKGGYGVLGYFYLETSRLPEAAAVYSRIIEIVPGDIDAYNQLGGIYALFLDVKKAISLFEKSYALDQNGYAFSNLATLYYLDAAYEKAAAIYEKLAAATGADINYEVEINLAQCYRFMKGKETQAQAIFNKLIPFLAEKIKANPGEAVEWAFLGLCYAFLGQESAAALHMEKALEIMPYNPDIILFAVLISELAGTREKTLEAVKNYLEHYGSMLYLERDPLLTQLRADARYREIVSSTAGSSTGS